MRGITRDSLLEFIDRKVIWVFAALLLLGILIVLLTGKLNMGLELPISDNADVEGLDALIRDPLMRVFNGFLGIFLFLAVMASAGLFPRMLERGRIDFYLSKWKYFRTKR